MKKLFQPFHLVTLSPWPLLLSLELLLMFLSIINLFKNFEFDLILLNLFNIILILYQWWRDVIRESTYQGYHTSKVVLGLKFSMILFILSELFFFISIFWSYFHFYLSPSIEIGSIWPPKNIMMFNPLSIPLLNTLLLLSSGVLVTLSHYSLILKNKHMMIKGLIYTLLLGILFLFFQFIEYSESSFSISDSVYGSIFYFSTGFHGLHVLIGVSFLLICLFRMFNKNFSSHHHFGFEGAIWYWHFVDVVWLFLYIFVYFLPY